MNDVIYKYVSRLAPHSTNCHEVVLSTKNEKVEITQRPNKQDISFHFIFIHLRRLLFQQKLIFKGPSIKKPNYNIQLRKK